MELQQQPSARGGRWTTRSAVRRGQGTAPWCADGPVLRVLVGETADAVADGRPGAAPLPTLGRSNARFGLLGRPDRVGADRGRGCFERSRSGAYRFSSHGARRRDGSGEKQPRVLLVAPAMLRQRTPVVCGSWSAEPLRSLSTTRCRESRQPGIGCHRSGLAMFPLERHCFNARSSESLVSSARPADELARTGKEGASSGHSRACTMSVITPEVAVTASAESTLG